MNSVLRLSAYRAFAILGMMLGLLSLAPDQALAVECERPQAIYGQISAVDADARAFNVAGMVFHTDADTQFFNIDGSTGGFAMIQQGEWANVEFCPTASGMENMQLIATEVHLLDPTVPPEPEMVTFTGRISLIENDSLVVGHNLVILDQNIVYEDFDGSSLVFEDFVVGDCVTVAGIPLPSIPEWPVFLAEGLRKSNDCSDPNLETVSGRVTDIFPNETSFELDGHLHVTTTSETVFMYYDDRPAGFGDLALDMYVAVRGYPSTIPEEFEARKVILRPQDPVVVTLAGEIEAIDTTNQSLIVQGTQVLTDNETEITGPGGEVIPFADLHQGLFVEIVGIPMDTTTDPAGGDFLPVVLAKMIHVPGEPGPTHLFGPIRDIDYTAATFLLNEFQVITNNETEIIDMAGNAVDFSVLAETMTVEAIGEVTRYPEPTSAGTIGLGEFVANQIFIRSDEPPLIHIAGPIERIESTNHVIYMLDWAVQINNQTLIVDANGNNLPFSDLSEGLLVEAIGEELPATDPAGTTDPNMHQMLAQEIHVFGEVPPQHVCGPITAIDSTGSLTINDIVVMIGPDTQIVDAANNPIPFSDLTTDMHACAEGEWQADGVFFAHLIIVEDPRPPVGEPIIVHGQIESLATGRTAMMVDGRPIVLNDQTRIFNFRGDPLEFSDLAVGDRVAVAGLTILDSTDGAVEARFVLVFGEPGDGLVIEGRVNFVDFEQNLLIVNRIPISISNETEFIDGRERSDFGMADLFPGDIVRINAYLSLNSASDFNLQNLRLVAETVTLLDREDIPCEPIQLEGVVEELDTTSNTLVVQGHFIRTTDRTEIHDPEGNLVGFDALAVEQFVHVGGVVLDDDSVLAHFIQILPNPEPREVEISGNISRINPNEGRLVVAGRPVQVTPETAIIGPNGGLLEFGDLQVGMFVTVRGVVNPGTNYIVAFEIELEDPICPEVHLNGPIMDFLVTTQDNLVGGMIVGEENVLIAWDTRLIDHETNEPLEISDFQIGDWVHVEGCLDGAGNIMANVVVRLAGEPGEPCPQNSIYFGTIDSIDESNMAIDSDGILVVINPDTVLLDSERNPITFGDLTVGADFRVVGWLTSEAAISACELRLLEPVAPPAQPDHIRGRIVSIDAAAKTLLIGETTVQVVEATQIISRKGEPLNFADLQVGQLVDVAGQRASTGVLVAQLIKVQEENPGPGDDDPRTVVLRDFITDFGTSGTMTVGATPVIVDADTVIHGFDGEPIAMADLNIGDYVRVRGTEDEGGVVTAITIDVRLTVIQDIDREALTLVANGRTVQAVEQTVIREHQGDAIEFADLAIGDLVNIQVHIQDGELIANVITRHASVTTGGMEMFDITSGRINELGQPAIVSASNNTFGYVALPQDSFTGDPDTLYEVRVRVATNIENRSEIPTLRLRTNLRNFAKGNCLVVDSYNGGTFSPTTDGFEYTFVMTAPVEMESASLLERQWFLSMDMLNFDSQFAQDAEFRLQGIDVRPIDMDRLSVARTFIDDRFAAGTNGWVFSGWPERFTPPAAGTGASGSLDLAATDTNTFGFWFKDTGVTLEAGKIYRARFLVKSASTNPETVPEFRLRINSSAANLAAVVNISSENGGPESPIDGARAYDAYLVMPKNATGNARALVAFDILNFNDQDDLNKAISLEEFIFEELVLMP
ncbi:hypothetical protein KQI84_14930 [bacterium]|nr:hypothetical protein [bacterium]